MYQLYGFAESRAIAVQMVLEEAELAYEYIHADPRESDAARQALLKVNPAGFVPVLVTPAGEVLHETAAIMIYLAETHDLHELMPPVEHPLRARFFTKLFYQTSDIQPSMKRTFYPQRFTTDRHDADKVYKAAAQMARDRWQVLDSYLHANGPFHLGSRFSLLDLHMAVWASYGLESVTSIIDEFDAVAAVCRRVAARPKSGHLLVAFQDLLAA